MTNVENFIDQMLSHTGEDCVLWPWSINPVSGYPYGFYQGKCYRVHRLVCRMVHGEPPTVHHHAAHDCHTRNCVNPRHLAWKTASENMLDRRENDTAQYAHWSRAGKLTPEQVEAIRALKGQLTQDAIAKAFGITESTVRSIHEQRTWKTLDKRSPQVKRVAELLTEAGAPLPFAEIIERAAVTQAVIANMFRRREIVRVSRGVYTLPTPEQIAH